jgi:hypothetical protein
MRNVVRRALIAVVVASLFAGFAGTRLVAQDDTGAPQRGAFAGMQRVNGEVTAVAGSTVTIKSEDGATYQVTVTDNTRVMKGRGNTIKVSDLKVGDGLMAAGNLDAPNKTMHAALVMAVDAAQVKALKDNLGKTYIAGKVTAIDVDNAKMTVERPDKVSQVIGFDETTSFRRGRPGRGAGMGAGSGAAAAAPVGGESITLADIKVGDQVGGNGAVKNGVFVPLELTVATPGQRRQRPAAAGAPSVAPGTN